MPGAHPSPGPIPAGAVPGAFPHRYDCPACRGWQAEGRSGRILAALLVFRRVPPLVATQYRHTYAGLAETLSER